MRVYRPIIDQTPDVFLNTICFDKEIMHRAFIAAPIKIREFDTCATFESWTD